MIAADSISRLLLPRRHGEAGLEPRHFRAHDRRDHLEGRRVADARREEQHHEHREEAPEGTRLILDAEEVENAENRRDHQGEDPERDAAAAVAIRQPPVAEREIAPTSGPRKTNFSESTSRELHLGQQRERRPSSR